MNYINGETMKKESVITNSKQQYDKFLRMISILGVLTIGFSFIEGYKSYTLWISLNYLIVIFLGFLAFLMVGKNNELFFLQTFGLLLILNGLYEALNIILGNRTTMEDLTKIMSMVALGSLLMLTSRSFTVSGVKQDVIWRGGVSNGYAVELIDVVKDYILGPIVVHALRGVNLRVRKGEFIAIMGPSGSGKSTLLNLIGALDRPTSGKVLIDGVDISKLNDDQLAYLRNKKIGFIFQAYNLINRTNVLRNVEMPSIVSGLSKRERIEKAKRLLEAVGLKEEAYRQPKYLSGGQQQRVAIARALMNDPTIILADEPTGNLDSKTGAEVMNYLKKMNKEFGTTVIVVTHDREVAEYADRIVHLKDGKIVDEEILKEGDIS